MCKSVSLRWWWSRMVVKNAVSVTWAGSSTGKERCQIFRSFRFQLTTSWDRTSQSLGQCLPFAWITRSRLRLESHRRPDRACPWFEFELKHLVGQVSSPSNMRPLSPSYLLGHVPQEYLLRTTYRRCPVIVNEFVEWFEWPGPDEVLVVAEKYLEMLHAVVEPSFGDGKKKQVDEMTNGNKWWRRAERAARSVFITWPRLKSLRASSRYVE